MNWEPPSFWVLPSALPSEEVWLAEVRVKLRRTRAPETLRARIAAMLAVEDRPRV